MGNWRTVELKGKMSNQDDVKGIIEYLTVDRKDYESKASEDGIFYLQFGSGICGINQWVGSNGEIDVCGNVYERDCEVDDLERELNRIAACYPSLDMVLHVGGDYEDTNCVASFIVRDGLVQKVEPLINELSGINSGYMKQNFMKAILR